MTHWDPSMQIQGNTFLVSGGSSGLGAACVRLFASAGGNVVIADLNRDAGEKLAAEIGAGVRIAPSDETDEASTAAAIDVAIKQVGGLRGAVLCAGIGVAERLLGKSGPHPLDSFTKAIRVNLIGTFNVMRLAAAVMSQAAPLPNGERGVVICRACGAALEGRMGQPGYSASKGGFVPLPFPAGRDLARFGIRVATIAPGTFDTPLLAGLPKPARQSLAQQVPFPSRLGRP